MKEDKNLQTIAKGAIILLAGLFVARVFGYVYRVILAKSLGPEAYGLVSLVIAIFSILTSLSLLGINAGVSRYISYYLAKDEIKKARQIITSSIQLTLPLSILLAAATFFLSNTIATMIFHNPQLSILIKIVAFFLPFNTLRNIFFNVARAYKKAHLEAIFKEVTENGSKVLLTIIFLFLGYKVMGATLAYALAILLSFIGIVYFSHKKLIPFKLKIGPINKELFTYSLPLLLNDFIYLIILWTDTIMLGIFMGAAKVGIYNAALPTSQLLYIFPYALMVLFLPVLTKVYAEEDKKEFKNLYTRTTKWVLMVNLIPIGLFLLFPKQILYYLFNPEFVAASSAFIILSISYYWAYLTLSSRSILLTLKKTKLILVNTSFAAILNIVLNLIFIPKYGLMGAAIATGTSVILLSLLRYTETYFITKINPFKVKHILIFLSAAISSAIVYYLTKRTDTFNIPTLIGLAILYVVIYVILLFLTRSVEKDDLTFINILKHKFFK